MKAKKIQLKNGLKVLFFESHRAPVVSVQMWVRTGSADESRSEQGISHFIEHLVFKGTRKYQMGEIARTVESCGGELNAYTSFDQTVFYITISKEYSEIAYEGISEMMGFPTFDPKEIDNEREVVVEEIKRGVDNPSRQASEALFSAAYNRHPYRYPVIGYEKNIRSWSAKKIKKYFHQRYAPRNMFLVVAGDLDSKKDIEKISKYFTELKDYRVKKTARKKDLAQKTPRVLVKKTNFQQNIGYLAWKIPNIQHKDIPALDVLSIILGQGDSSRLVKRLRLHEPLVNSIGSSAYTPKDEGLFIISFGFPQENLEKILTCLREELSNLLGGQIEEDEIKSAVINLESEQFYSQETADGLARRIGSLEFYFRDLEMQKKYLNQIRNLTEKELLRVARKYLKYENFTASISIQNGEQAATLHLKNWLRNWKQTLKNLPSVSGKSVKIKHGHLAQLSRRVGTPHVQKIQLTNHITLLLRQDKDTEVISAKAAFLGGARLEGQNQDGLCELLGLAWLSGTKSKNENQLMHEIESIGSAIQPVSGRHSLGLGLDTLNLFEEKAKNIFIDVLTNPIFSIDAIEREKAVMLEHIKMKKDNPAQMCMRLFAKTMFLNHPYCKDPMGTEETIGQLGQREIIQLWEKTATQSNLTISLCGNFNEKSWLKSVEKEIRFKKGARIEFTQRTPDPITNEMKVFEPSKKEQTHIVYGFRGLHMKDPRRYTLQVIQSILAGQGGRLFLELRDKNSLAYTVAPIHMEGIETGYFGAYIGCSPDKSDKAISMMKQEFEKLCNQLVPEEELLRAKRYIIGRHDIDLQKSNQLAAAILYNDIYGIDYNEPFKVAKNLLSISNEDIRDLARIIFKQNPVVAKV